MIFLASSPNFRTPIMEFNKMLLSLEVEKDQTGYYKCYSD
jgi:hypothetical protein